MPLTGPENLDSPFATALAIWKTRLLKANIGHLKLLQFMAESHMIAIHQKGIQYRTQRTCDADDAVTV
jgi:hypothetical protein